MPDGLTLLAWLVFLTARLALEAWSAEEQNVLRVSGAERSGKWRR